jgi:hypothetical protein
MPESIYVVKAKELYKNSMDVVEHNIHLILIILITNMMSYVALSNCQLFSYKFVLSQTVVAVIILYLLKIYCKASKF